MGSLCKQTQQIKQYNKVKIIKNQKHFDNISFNFSTDKISRINCDCLILYTDIHLKVKKNKYLLMVGTHTAQKIQQYFDAQIVDRKIHPGNAVLFEIDFKELSFQYVCIVCLGVWSGASHIQQPLEIAMQQSFRAVKQHGCQKIAITEIDQEYGIPVQNAYQCLTRAIYQQKSAIQSITYLCDTDTDQQQASSAIMKFQPDDLDKSRRSSVYY